MSYGLATRGVIGGGGGTATTPAFTSVSPVDGSELEERTTPVTFTVDNPSICPFTINVKFASDGRTFTAYCSSRGFLFPFEELSTVDDSNPVAPEFSLVQNRGWQDTIDDIFIGGVA